jgi:histidine ammonia-lyase
VRQVAAFLDRDRPMEGDIAALAEEIQSGRGFSCVAVLIH